MAEDLTRYFQAEARELCDELARGLLGLEREPGRADLVARCFRAAHTLKGAARTVGMTAIGDLAHAVEDALAPHRDGRAPLDRGLLDDLLEILGAIRGELSLSEREEEPAPLPGEGGEVGGAEGDRIDTVRVELAELDAVLEGLLEARAQLGPLRRAEEALDQAQALAAAALAALGSGRAPGPVDTRAAAQARGAMEEVLSGLAEARRDLEGAADRIAQELGEAQRSASALRLVPVSAALGQLELCARDAARALGKEVELSAAGAEIRVEGQILAAARDALLHLVRNAVDHGIEPPEERLAAGKPAAGRIRITVERRGRRVAFLCSDDGRGVDGDAVRRAALDRGLLSPEEAAALSPEEALSLVFRAGVSTRAAVTAVSGRGVGLDVVRDVAGRLNGRVSVESEPGRGTTIGVEVPISVASLSALALEHDGATALVPLDAVLGALRLPASTLGHDAAGPCLVHEGEVLPFVPLSDVLRAPGATARALWSAVIVQAGARRLALGADRLLGVVDAMLKPLPASAGRPKAVAGAALDAEGAPLLVLDPAGIDPAARGASTGAPSGPARARRPPILVIDDSLTTRMLEQSILESAGYEVDLAASGEEGLEKAAARRYGLFIVDVEMGGMSGLEFTALTRADPALRGVPVLLVTSLSSAADRRRGAEAGAAGYIVKGEFDQRRFVRQVAELMG